MEGTVSDKPTALRYGTYVREPDGANLVYHSDLCSWNDPVTALRLWTNHETTSSLSAWRIVFDDDELAELKSYLGSNLKSGESTEVYVTDV